MIFTPRKINNTNLTPSEASQTLNPWFILAVLCIPVFLGSLDLTVVSAFLPELMADLGITINTESLASTSWVLISYLMAYSISLFAMGRVSDLIGRRKALAICLSLYIVGSAFVVFYEAPADLLGHLYNALGIEFETSLIKLHAIIGARAVAAFGAGAITSIALALVSDMFEAEARATPLGIIAGTDTVGWLIGAAWGGLVVQFFPWKAIFLINIPLVFIATPNLIPRPPPACSAVCASVCQKPRSRSGAASASCCAAGANSTQRCSTSLKPPCSPPMSASRRRNC
jgi:MFS family permease